MILFLSEYPLTEKQLKDGFFQRVINIDSYFEKEERVYISISLFNFLTKDVHKIDDRLSFIKCNFFFHFFFIYSLFKKSSLVYIQSLFNTLYTFLFILLVKNKYALDLHGVVIEELELTGKKNLSQIFSFIEGRIYKKLDYVISVTDQLSNYYKRKYPNVKVKYFKYAILPNNLNTISPNEIIKNSDGETVRIIYSGNLQKWQNVDLMLSVIKENLFYNFEYTILTGDKNGMIDLLKKHGLNDNEQIKVASVHPSELQDYYQVAHYGFVLRDDIIVNNVACPTKIIEYMCYGIIPIVLSDNIGDFKDLGYDRIDYKNINKELKPKKSIVNMEIIDKLKQTNVFNLPIFNAV